ncbi:putative F-box protein At5g62060 [Bidens hawaiensis]|uniref:putative F-box protein At5g62060 n=1 Tax=Bidens hawaiensis TaxID=980011 RepID=UPI0040496FC7
MSDYLPFEIQDKIMKMLPVKSLIQFQSVSKTWKSWIDSSSFVETYNHQQTPHVLQFCDGLRGTAVIWNPCIRRALMIDIVPAPAPTRGAYMYNTVLGFGVCRVTNDPKIVKISYSTIVRESDDVRFQVDLFTLSTRAWRSLSESDKLPRKSLRFDFLTKTSYSVAIDGFVYWLAIDKMAVCWLIVSFDMTSEEFGEVNLSNRLARSQHKLHMSKLGESLVLLEHVEEPDRSVYSVWTMEGGSGLFTQLYTFNVNTPNNVSLLGYRLRGDAIIEITNNGITEFVVYERLSKRINNLGFRASELFSAHPYMETLFLHDHPDLTLNTEALQDN